MSVNERLLAIIGLLFCVACLAGIIIHLFESDFAGGMIMGLGVAAAVKL